MPGKSPHRPCLILLQRKELTIQNLRIFDTIADGKTRFVNELRAGARLNNDKPIPDIVKGFYGTVVNQMAIGCNQFLRQQYNVVCKVSTEHIRPKFPLPAPG